MSKVSSAVSLNQDPLDGSFIKFIANNDSDNYINI